LIAVFRFANPILISEDADPCADCRQQDLVIDRASGTAARFAAAGNGVRQSASRTSSGTDPRIVGIIESVWYDLGRDRRADDLDQ
jgi:hypothetical protein